MVIDTTPAPESHGQRHVPDMLLAQQQHTVPSEFDERRMRMPLPPLDEFEGAIIDAFRTRLGQVVILDMAEDDVDVVHDLIQALARVPNTARGLESDIKASG